MSEPMTDEELDALDRKANGIGGLLYFEGRRLIAELRQHREASRMAGGEREALEALGRFADALQEAQDRYPEAGSAYVLQEACSHLELADFERASQALAAPKADEIIRQGAGGAGVREALEGAFVSTTSRGSTDPTQRRAAVVMEFFGDGSLDRSHRLHSAILVALAEQKGDAS